MRHEIVVDQDVGIIKVSAEGDWNVADSDIITGKIVDKSEETGIVKILIDHSKITINVSTLIAYKRPLQLKSQFEHIYPKVVFISPKNRYKLYRFFITVARNRGIQFEVFKDYKSALEWLLV